MNVNEYIESTKQRNRHLFNATKIQITPESLEVLLRHAFGAGEENSERKATPPPPSIFEQLFGRQDR